MVSALKDGMPAGKGAVGGKASRGWGKGSQSPAYPLAARHLHALYNACKHARMAHLVGLTGCGSHGLQGGLDRVSRETNNPQSCAGCGLSAEPEVAQVLERTDG